MKRKRELSFDELVFRQCQKSYGWTRKEYRQWKKDVDERIKKSDLEKRMDAYIKKHGLDKEL